MLCAAFSAGRAQQPTLGDATMRVEFSAADGHVRALRDWNSRKLAGADSDSIGLWSLDLAPGGSSATINAVQAKHFEWRRTSDRAIELAWSDFAGTPAPQLKVLATVQLRSDTTTTWRIRIEGIRGVEIDRVRYPRLTNIVTSGSGEELAVPSWMGQRSRNPATMLAGNDGKGRRIEFVYPGALSMQAIALSSAKHGGLYLSADDSAAFRKSFALWGSADGSAGYDMVHLLPNPGTLNVFSPPYASIVGVVHGDWFSAVERYRKWGTAQYWARESRLHTGNTPEWLRQTGIWVWNRGHSDVVLEPAADLMKDAKLPVSVFWHWWHNGPYDTSFPDYLPPREGAEHFTNAVKTAHSVGLHTIVYMNQRLWCINTPSWTREGAERWAVHERDGK